MSDDVEDSEVASDRLEAALERIARLSAARPVPVPLDDPHAAVDAPESGLSIPEIAERLDSLIARLRAALGELKA